MTDANELFISVPRDVSIDLIERRIARPLLRADRVDAELFPAIAIAVASAATTVVVTDLSKAAIKGLTEAVRRWLGKAPAPPQITVSIATHVHTTTRTIDSTSSSESLDDLETVLLETLTQTDAAINLLGSASSHEGS